MKNTSIAFITIFIFALLFLTLSCERKVEEPQAEQYRPSIQIVDMEGQIPTKNVRRGDSISWDNTTDDTLYFQFMDNRLIVRPEQATGIFQFMLPPRQTSQEYRIGGTARQDTNYYAVFMYGRRAFAKSESPPKLIVE